MKSVDKGGAKGSGIGGIGESSVGRAVFFEYTTGKLLARAFRRIGIGDFESLLCTVASWTAGEGD